MTAATRKPGDPMARIIILLLSALNQRRMARYEAALAAGAVPRLRAGPQASPTA
jgi:hypothetical protein